VVVEKNVSIPERFSDNHYMRENGLEPISKIVAKGSGQGVPLIDNGAYTQYVSISIHGTTQPWAFRRIFEIGSNDAAPHSQ
jgi:hypothetical protein